MRDQALSSLYTEAVSPVRPRVREGISRYAAMPLVLVEAPAGYGKTVAVNDYLYSLTSRIAWLDLSLRDNEPAIFLRHLYEAFRQSGLPFNLSGSASFANNYGFWNVEEQFRIICAEKPLYLVLDNYHHIQNSQIDRFVEDTARLRIENLHIYVLTRYRPGFSVTDLLLKNMLGLVNAEDLRFTPQEIASYMDRLSLGCGPTEAERIFSHTGGWPAAIRLLANAKTGGKDNKIRFNLAADISNLFEKEIFSYLDENTRAFLLRISILDEFPVSLAAHISGFDSATRILHNLAENSLLATYDPGKDAYCLNQVFLDYLRRQSHLADKQEQIRQRKLAAEYYLGQKNYLRAMKFFLEIEDYDKMAAAIAMFLRKDGLESRQNSRIVRDYIDKMPGECRVKYPAVGLYYALCCLALNDYETCQETITELRNAFLQDIEVPFAIQEQLFGQIEMVHALLELNSLPAMVKCLKRALRMLGTEHFPVNVPPALVFSAPSLLVICHSQPGALDGELEQAAENNVMLQSMCGKAMGGMYELLAAEAAYLRCRFEEGEELAVRCCWLAERNMNYGMGIAAQFVLLRIAMQKGNRAACLQALKEIERIRQANTPIFDTARDICFAYYCSSVGDYSALPPWVSACQIDDNHSAGGGIIMEYIACARAAAAQKQFFQMENMALHLEFLANGRPGIIGQITAKIYLAAACFNRGRLKEAYDKLEQAWLLAEPDKLIGMFLEESALLLPVVQKLAQNNTGDITPGENWLNILLPQLKTAQRKRNQLAVAHVTATTSVNGRKTAQPAITLSKREKEVLNYLQEGITGKEMARIMNVSLNNIKGITTRIYNKLSVANKTEAIRVGQELGLL